MSYQGDLSNLLDEGREHRPIAPLGPDYRHQNDDNFDDDISPHEIVFNDPDPSPVREYDYDGEGIDPIGDLSE